LNPIWIRFLDQVNNRIAGSPYSPCLSWQVNQDWLNAIQKRKKIKAGEHNTVKIIVSTVATRLAEIIKAQMPTQ
jgi:hypothetical protein